MGNDEVQVGRDYHQATKHTEEKLRSDSHFLDWPNQPIPFKIYTSLEPIDLPRELGTHGVSALDALALSGRPATIVDEPGLDDLARVLYYSAGITKVKRGPGGEYYFRAAPNTGALYHIDLYLICGELPGLEAGVYHFGPHDFTLRRLRQGDYRQAVVEAAGDEARLATAAVILATASTYWRNAWKYRDRAYRHAFWDSGTLLGNLLAVGAAIELGPTVVAGFVDDDIERLLGLDPLKEGALSLIPLGVSTEPLPSPEAADPIEFETRPLSAEEIEYPSIREMHEASKLATPDEVAAWRSQSLALPEQAVEEPTIPLRPLRPGEWPPESLEDVIRRRGSTREFDPAFELTLAELSTAVDLATRQVPADFTDDGNDSLIDVYLIVHAVDGLEPGAYFFRRRDKELEPLRPGKDRALSGRLGLWQQLPADAAVNVYCLSDLDAVFNRFGNRGYRAAQLEGGIIGGRLYLAAYALGFGATGLTFLDDEVTDFFSPHAAGKSVMFLTALGRSARSATRTL